MHQNMIGKVFPFIPLVLGLLVMILAFSWGEPNAQLPIQMMFILIISCMISWLFSTIGLLIYKDYLLTYYMNLFKVLSTVYLLPAIILALFLPWTAILSLAIFLSGVIILRRHKPKAE